MGAMANSNRLGVYPGTFDPITNGHLDIIRRSSRFLDRLIVAVSTNAGKGPLFSIEERVALVKEEIQDPQNGLNGLSGGGNIEVVAFDNLLIQFAAGVHATFIIRGLRAVSDFEDEFQMAGMNTRLDPQIETLFLMASERHQFISSRFVKEIGKLGGDISTFVSPRVVERLHQKFAEDAGR
jgi:pantetheine-phosphate adenylyltransferase